MPYRKTAIFVGLLFISSTVTFAADSSLVHAYFSDATPSSETLFGGVFLEWYTASAVAMIGIALFPVLKPHGQNLSAGYLILRAMEGTAVIARGAYFLVSRHWFEDHVLLGYTCRVPSEGALGSREQSREATGEPVASALASMAARRGPCRPLRTSRSRGCQ
ncbi:DUF4386 family protein [Streptomyces sp. NPDC039022]|uniref:DUF4386 family protein n=1 Tax=unclassified Streptomyces TaxID=2593676 RepID=UPI0033C9F1FD